MCGYRARCEVVCNCFDSDITDNNNDNNNNNIKKNKVLSQCSGFCLSHVRWALALSSINTGLLDKAWLSIAKVRDDNSVPIKMP